MLTITNNGYGEFIVRLAVSRDVAERAMHRDIAPVAFDHGDDWAMTCDPTNFGPPPAGQPHTVRSIKSVSIPP